MAQLSTELILLTIESLIPSNPPVAYRPSDEVTKTLISCSLVCKGVSTTALRLLRAHCLFLDSFDRLELVASQQQPQSKIPAGLFLSPFPDYSIDAPAVVRSIGLLFETFKAQLTRVVVDAPFRYMDSASDVNGVRTDLRRAFMGLTGMEEFCSVRDELYLRAEWADPEVWCSWPCLARLALYNVDVTSPSFLAGFAKSQSLTHLVITRSDGLEELVEYSDWQPLMPRLRRVLIVNTRPGHLSRPPFDQQRWEGSFLERLWSANEERLTAASDSPGDALGDFLVRINVPVPVGREDEDIDVCQEWVRNRVIDGSLWNYPGSSIMTSM